MIAEFEGRCGECDQKIRVGARIVKLEGSIGWQHEVCPGSTRLDLGPGEVVCTECFVVKPCPCEDGL